MIRLVVFDCDGTLVDSQRRIIAAVRSAWEGQRLTPPGDEDIRQIVGLALPQALRRLAPTADPGLAAALVEGFRQSFHALMQDPDYDEPLYPGVVEALEALAAAGVLLGVATGKGRRGLAHTLERHGIDDRFVVLKTADDGPSKPHPQILEDAMSELGAAPATTVMLGDTAFDMAMARAAGAHALGVSWGYHPADELTAHGAHEILHSYDEAPAAVLRRLDTAR